MAWIVLKCAECGAQTKYTEVVHGPTGIQINHTDMCKVWDQVNPKVYLTLQAKNPSEK